MVPTKILIWVTPDEKILGINLRKKDFIFSSIFILNVKIGIKFFLTKNNKINKKFWTKIEIVVIK